MKRSLAGEFQIQDLGQGRLRITALTQPLDMWVHGTDPRVNWAADTRNCTDISVEWCEEDVILTITRNAAVSAHRAHSVLIHEPLATLYEHLPLPVFDARAKRFWRRIFALLRLPGGRYLLSVLARRAHRER